jgi:DUF4097 and DUF4098 domain-containing protein YvlB
MKLIWLPAVVLASSIAQTDSGLTREGAYWTRTTSGSIPLPAAGRLRVTTRGALIARGESGAKELSYQLKQRTKARGEADARRIFDQMAVRSRTQGDYTHLVVSLRDSGSAELTLKIPRGVRECVLETQGGNVEARDLDGTVHAVTGGGQIQMDRIGGQAVARTAGGHVRIGNVQGKVQCQSAGGSIVVDRAGGEALFETAGGEIVIREAAGPVRASTAGGNIHIERAASSVWAQTAGGLIEIGEAGGVVTAETSGGSIQVGRAKGVRCESGAGAIRLRGVSGTVRASTGAGSILAELIAGRSLEDSSLTTASGDVVVLIPSNLAIAVRAQNEAGRGRILSEFPEIRVTAAERARQIVAEGVLNDGGPLLKISAANGTIYLRRQK